jgi:trimethylamine--corrinoid protein Co-methyltransferase
LKLSFELLNEEEAKRIHRGSIEILEKTGMRFESETIRRALKAQGADVDESGHTVCFPQRLVEDALESNRSLQKAGRKLHLLNGVTSQITGNGAIAAKISGGCEKYLDWPSQTIREATAAELLRYIRVGEIIPEVDFVGNPIVLRVDLNGDPIEERMRRVETASLIARNTRKLGSMEIWDTKEIDLMVEIGTIARGGAEHFREKPCFVTAKETISPLFLDEHSGTILLELAKRDLPCTIIPMPLSGLSSPVSIAGNALVGNAEILAVITAIKAVCPEALVGGGTISGIIDMRSAAVSFSAPEAILQDIMIAEVHEKIYGQNYLIGSGYTDAKYPNHQLTAEKSLKFLLTFLSGRTSYPVGLINSGAVFSLEQALVDLEICRYIHAHFGRELRVEAVNELVDLISTVGIRGSFLDQEHTLMNYRDNWMSGLFDTTSFVSLEDTQGKDIYNQAHRETEELLSGNDFYRIDHDRSREIDRVVEAARRIL